MIDKKYKDLLESIDKLLQENKDNPFEAEDEKLNIAIAVQKRNEDEEYDKRNELYTELLKSYIYVYNGKEKAKAIYKGIFFTVTMILFFGIIALCIGSMMAVAVRGDGSIADIVIAFSSIAGIISTLIILPKIIAEHLFPADEESKMISMVRSMQDNDANIRDFIYKTRDSQDNQD